MPLYPVHPRYPLAPGERPLAYLVHCQLQALTKWFGLSPLHEALDAPKLHRSLGALAASTNNSAEDDDPPRIPQGRNAYLPGALARGDNGDLAPPRRTGSLGTAPGGSRGLTGRGLP